MQYIIIRYTIASETYDHKEIDYLFLDYTDTFLDLMKEFKNFTDVFIHADVYANVYQYSIPIFNAVQKLMLASDIIRNKFSYRHADVLLHFVKMSNKECPISGIKFSIIPDEI